MAELNYSPAGTGKHAMKRLSVRVDLTAMVDLAFLLITFFMLATTLSKPKQMPLIMPANEPGGPVPESRSMTVCLGKNNQVLYYLGLPDKPLAGPLIVKPGETLRKALVETSRRVLATTGKELIVVLKPDEHCIYSNLVDALDELDIANVKTYAIAKISAKDKDMLKQRGIY